MKILIIGGNGTIGKKVSERFSKKHEVVIGGRHSGDVRVDIADSKSIENMFENARIPGNPGNRKPCSNPLAAWTQLSASRAKPNGQILTQ